MPPAPPQVPAMNLSRPPASGNRPQALPLELPGYQTWLLRHSCQSPTGLPVLMLHGIQSHPGWFAGSADAVAASGRTVYQFLRRGSGCNARARGHARSPGQLLADLDVAVDFVLGATGASRLHLVGISWGGKYAACWALSPHRVKRLAGLTLVAPGLAPRVDLSVRAKLVVAACALAAPRLRLAIPLNEPELFTDNPAMREYIRTDPCRLTRATAAFFLTSRRMDWMLARAADAALRLPVNLLLASRDRIIDNAPTRNLLARLAGDTLRVVELPGAHTLEFEPDPQPFFTALVNCCS
jgi:acylglycerol lipase